MTEQLDLPIGSLTAKNISDIHHTLAGTLEPGSNQQTLTYWEQIDALINRKIPSRIGRGQLPDTLGLLPFKDYAQMTIEQLKVLEGQEDWRKPLNWDPQEDVKFDVIPALLSDLRQYCVTEDSSFILTAIQELVQLSIRDALRKGILPVFISVSKILKFPTE